MKVIFEISIDVNKTWSIPVLLTLDRHVNILNIQGGIFAAFCNALGS